MLIQRVLFDFVYFLYLSENSLAESANAIIELLTLNLISLFAFKLVEGHNNSSVKKLALKNRKSRDKLK